MPFCYDYYRLSEGGRKRRRLFYERAMARRPYDEQQEEAGGLLENEELLPATETESQPTSANRNGEVETSDRDELIQRIKRGEKPTWIPKPGLEALIAETEDSHPPHCSCLDIKPDSTTDTKAVDESHSSMRETGADTEPIERPRSAFHSGDFYEPPSGDQIGSPRVYPRARTNLSSGFSTSPPPWHSSPPHPSLGRARTDLSLRETFADGVRRSRAPSLGSSLSSSFILRVPTSPLVHAINSIPTDHIEQDELKVLSFTGENKTNRRRALPPEAFQSLESRIADRRSSNFGRPLPTPQTRQGPSVPYHNHQPRRSLNSFTYQPASNPQTPNFPRSRRPSFASDTSPIQHASMVGSFEESILRGRMSTAPSKPLDFVAQIGVLGKGNCKPSLKCPAHVTVPFPAVFYSYQPSATGSSPADDSPSPYVGTIDLEHNLKPPEQLDNRKRRREVGVNAEERMADLTAPENTAIGRALARDAQRREKQTLPPKAPAGGCYRVPQQGQLQIIIKNPNKTAVKLYLVPYDLEGMDSGTKTFVRQRSFSAGPILEKPLSASPESATSFDSLQDKRILRYLIHLRFCCPSKGRFYLYDSIRVVFANRVPDGKEKLINEMQLPEPKFSPYRPGRDDSMGAAGARLAAEKAVRRQSSGFGVTTHLYNQVDGLRLDTSRTVDEVPPLPNAAIPFHLTPRIRPPFLRSESDQGVAYCHPDTAFDRVDISEAKGHNGEIEVAPTRREYTSTDGFDASSLVRRSPIPTSPEAGSPIGRNYSPVPPEFGEGLLSRKFREHREGSAGDIKPGGQA